MAAELLTSEVSEGVELPILEKDVKPVTRLHVLLRRVHAVRDARSGSRTGLRVPERPDPAEPCGSSP